jgi:hypothetical protein
VSAVRPAAPRVVAEVRADDEDGVPFRMLYVSNIGAGSAYNVTVSGTLPDARNASSSIKVLAANEARYAFGLSYPAQEYARLSPIFRADDERT